VVIEASNVLDNAVAGGVPNIDAENEVDLGSAAAALAGTWRV
jgi:hypothetical protein